ncbi:hypothetical protein CGRA01v4_04806 [Colletotrichum graminicola]|nr:hypothetical protein CGRA01v4_04806 [Colletotrichum graminicola]
MIPNVSRTPQAYSYKVPCFGRESRHVTTIAIQMEHLLQKEPKDPDQVIIHSIKARNHWSTYTASARRCSRGPPALHVWSTYTPPASGLIICWTEPYELCSPWRDKP